MTLMPGALRTRSTGGPMFDLLYLLLFLALCGLSFAMIRYFDRL